MGMTAARLVPLLIAAAAGGAHAETLPSDGAKIYAAGCARCHGSGGKSESDEARALKVRPLVDDAVLRRMSAQEIAAAIRSNAKHQGFAAIDGMDGPDLDAVAAFVKRLAEGQR
ncbi:MAG: cytochrome c [Deltaproteobacteria bacterium]|nr:cytochrome c [Deltaproteobacteria bacterium]